jgi:hypothetical protein
VVQQVVDASGDGDIVQVVPAHLHGSHEEIDVLQVSDFVFFVFYQVQDVV